MMPVTKPIVVYSNVPIKKVRWIAYVACIQNAFVLFNIFVMPTPTQIEEKRKAIEEHKRNIEQIDTSTISNNGSDVSSKQGDGSLVQIRKMLSLKNAIDNFKERPYLCPFLIGFSALVTTAFVTFARRSAHMITLLPNQKVRFESFPAFGFGKPPSIEVPLRDVSCVQGRKSQTNYSILKFKGKLGYHLVSKKDGHFLEPKLYDKHLGYQRSWLKTYN